MNSDLAALMRKACDDLIKSGKDAGEEYINYLKDIRKGLEESSSTYKNAEQDITHAVGKVGADGAKDGAKGLDQAGHDAAGGLASADEPKAGIKSGGTSSAETGATDPVDLVSGQLLDSVTDVVLPGVLPLVLRRSYASGYEHGLLLGPGWSSTLDTRLLVGGDGSVRFLGDDAQCLDFGVPNKAAIQLGQPAYPDFGPRWALDIDAAQRAWTVTDPRAGVSYLFVAGGFDSGNPVQQLSVIRDRFGNEIRVHRDDEGDPVRLEHSAGYRVRVALTQTPAGTRLAGYDVEDGGRLAGFGYDDAGCLVTVSDSYGTDHRYTYDARARIISWTDRSGFEYPYQYDESGRVVETGEPGGFKHARIDYNPESRVTRVTDALGHTTEYHYDRFQQVTKVVDPLGAETRMVKDSRGRVLERATPLGRTTRFTYNEDGDPVRVTYPDGQSLAMTYHGPGRFSRVDLPDGASWQYTWDENGNVLTETDPLGAVTRFEYDDHGAPAAITDPLGAVTRYENDPAGLPVAAIAPNGARTTITRDAQGRITAVTAPDGGTRMIEYDSEGRVLVQAEPGGSGVRYEYDASGNRVASTAPSGQGTRIEYGPFHLPVARTAPDGTRWSYGYDAELQLTTVTGPTGLTWSYQYDKSGRLVAERDFDGLQKSYEFDEDGALVASTAPDGEVTTYQRDAAGNLTELRAGSDVSRFGYDTVGRMVRAENEHAAVTITRDALGRAVREDVNGHAITRAFDAAGNTIARTTPSGAASRWAFDAIGNPLSLTAGPGTLTFTHDPFGREAGYVTGSIALTHRFDPDGLLTGQRVITGGRVLQERTYGYNADGLATRVTDLLRGPQKLRLDPSGRITEALSAGRSERYSYDAIGNLTSADITQNPTGPESADLSGQYTAEGTRVTHAGRTSYSYDARGRLIGKTRRTLSGQRLTWTYDWDAHDRLVAVERPDGQRWAYRYDPFGRRIEKTRIASDGTAAETTRFAWDETVLAEQSVSRSDGRDTILTWDYEPGSYTPTIQRRSSQPDTDAEFWAIAANLAGAPQELISPEGTIDWARQTLLWGRPADAAAPAAPDLDCPLGFPGQYYDAESGLWYNNQRYYDPDTGYYLSPDPLGLDAAPHPQRYVSNPLAATDPLGLTPQKPAWKSDSQLQADADLMHEMFGQERYARQLRNRPDQPDDALKWARKARGQTTVSTFQENDHTLRYSVNNSGSFRGMDQVAAHLGYGQDSRAAGSALKNIDGKAHAEQLILKKIGPDAEGRMAISREFCDLNPRSTTVEDCARAIAQHGGVSVVGRFRMPRSV